VHDAEVGLLQQVPMLRTLPLPSVEQLARGLEALDLPAGSTLFRQGDVGDRYYVVESGEVEVVGDGRVVATLGPGEGFGEIALLRRTGRTATVRARSDVRLRALGADHFLTAVLGYTPSAREAALGVDRLLDRWDPGRPAGDPPPSHP
jgi:CRP-like cAMP-binding protein